MCLTLQSDAEKMYMMFKEASIEKTCTPGLIQCGSCVVEHTNSFKILSPEIDTVKETADFVDIDLPGSKKVIKLSCIDKTSLVFRFLIYTWQLFGFLLCVSYLCNMVL